MQLGHLAIPHAFSDSRQATCSTCEEGIWADSIYEEIWLNLGESNRHSVQFLCSRFLPVWTFCRSQVIFRFTTVNMFSTKSQSTSDAAAKFVKWKSTNHVPRMLRDRFRAVSSLHSHLWHGSYRFGWFEIVIVLYCSGKELTLRWHHVVRLAIGQSGV